MAFIDIDSIDPVNHASFYNVDEAVGYGCRNFTEDVKVVQFFLKRIYSLDRARDTKPRGEMIIDGKCGPITRAWIVSFQLDCINRGGESMVDGIIDRAGNSSDNWQGSYSHTIYSIRMCNNILRDWDTEVYKNLTTSPAVPPDMRLIFMKIQASGPPMNYASKN